MAININANMSLGAAEYLDARQSVATLDDLLNLNTNIIPNGFEVYVNDLDCKYKYHEDYNEASTGNWKLSTGGTGHIEITQAEYDALSEEEKNNGAIYFITDAEGGEGGDANIDDNNISLDSIWSSEKIFSELNENYAIFEGIVGESYYSTNISAEDIYSGSSLYGGWTIDKIKSSTEMGMIINKYNAASNKKIINNFYDYLDVQVNEYDIYLEDAAKDNGGKPYKFALLWSDEDSIIDDGVIENTSTWSSEKTVTEMLNQYDRYVRIKGISGYRGSSISTFLSNLDTVYTDRTSYEIGNGWEITEVETNGWLPSEILPLITDNPDNYFPSIINVGCYGGDYMESQVYVNIYSSNTPFEVIFAGDIAKTQEDTKNYFTINTLQNTKYVKIIPDNEQRHITIVSEDGECVEIFGDNDNGDQYIEECPKAVRLSYGENQSFDASVKTANIERVLYNQTAGSKNFYVDCKSDLGYTIHGIKEQPQLVDGNSAEASQLLQQGLKEIPIISLIPEKDFYRVVAQDKAGYFKFKPSSDGGNEQPLRATATDNYGGMIEISGNAPSQDQYKPYKCVRLSNGTYASYDAANTTNNKMKKLYLYDGYMYLQVETYTTVTFTGLIEAPTFVETLADASTEIPIVSLVNPSIKAAAGSNINSVGTPSVTASESNGTTTFTFNYLKGAKGDKGDTPTIKAAAGSNINTVGTPSVTASTSGTTTTFTFNNLKGAKGDPGTTPTIKAAAGSNINSIGTPTVTASTSGTTTTFTFDNLKGAVGATPTIKAAAGSNIGSVGTPAVSASTSGTTTTFTFNYLKGAKGDKGDTGVTKSTNGPNYTICTLQAGQAAILFCVKDGGGYIKSSLADGNVYINGTAITSSNQQSTTIDVGKVYAVTNQSSSSSTTLSTYSNGGGQFMVLGPV